jgi:LPXTG-motif cell wall-anchored protein
LLRNPTRVFIASLVAVLTLSSSAMSSAAAVALPGAAEQTGSLSPSGFVAGVATVESSGDFIWAATATAQKVFKVNKTTGALDTEFALPAGSTGTITRSSIDANYLWLNHTNSAGVTRVKLSDGTSEYFSTGLANNSDIASDGEFVWVTSTSAGKVFKLSAATGAVLSETTISYPYSVDTDGVNVWISYLDGSDFVRSITKLNRSTGEVLLPGISSGLVTGNLKGIRISGDSVFVFADRTQVFERSVSDGSLISEITFLGDNLSAIEVSGGTLWSFSSNNSKGRQYDLVSRTGANPTYDGDFDHLGSGIRNATFDGLNLWVSDISGKLIKRTASAQALTDPTTAPAPPANLASTGIDSGAHLALTASLTLAGGALLLWRRKLKKSLGASK